MATNLYHVLSFMPAVEKQDMYVELEALAQKLVRSGLIRISAINRRNFINFRIPQDGFSTFLSYRELYSEDLLPRTKALIRRVLARSSVREKDKDIDKQVAAKLGYLRYELKKFLEVPEDYEFKLARMLVQSCHPVIINLVLHERVPIFISFGQTVSELLDIRDWEDNRDAGGLQSTTREGAAVRVSCGGDPFLEEGEKYYDGDGFPAFARFMVIAAQELGHYADIIRDAQGNYISRHSVRNYSRPKREVNEARKSDMRNLDMLEEKLAANRLKQLVSLEDLIVFNEKHEKGNLLNRLKYASRKNHFIERCLSRKFKFIEEFPSRVYESDWLGRNIRDCMEDMRFNLEPRAFAYIQDTEEATEAMMCIEALARVPQQVVKWGHDVVRNCWPNFYKLYYQAVIPTCLRSLEEYTGQKITFTYTPYRAPILKKLFN